MPKWMVFTFIDKNKVVAGREGFETYSAFEDCEDNARMHVKWRYELRDMELEMISSFEDRRKGERRSEPRRRS